MPSGPGEALLNDVFGIPLLAYVCAVDREEIEDRLENSDALTRADAEALLRRLIPLAKDVVTRAAEVHHAGSEPPDGGPSTTFILNTLVFDADKTIGIWNAFRLDAGGTLPEAPATPDDELATVLLKLALIQFPRNLLPRDPWSPMSEGGLVVHPLMRRAVSLIHADDALSRLFTADDPGLGRRGFVWTNQGHGSTMQSVGIAARLFGAAWDAVSLTAAQPSYEGFSNHILDGLRILRSSALGSPTTTRAVVAFTGVTTEESHIETPWGSLRPLTEAERGDGLSRHESTGDLLLDTEIRYAVAVGDETEPSAEGPRLTPPSLPGQDDLQQRIEAVQLASMMTVPPESGTITLARPLWRWVFDPLRTSAGAPLRRSRRRSSSCTLAAPQAGDLSAWCARIAASRPASTDVAIRRVLSAAIDRAPADRLVDAVIAWENLFGSDTELSFRITASMAWLLEPSSTDDREALQTRLKGIYTTRSKILHGSVVDPRTVNAQSYDALHLAVVTLAALFRDRPDVLGLPDGAARSNRLLIGGPLDFQASDQFGADPGA